MATDIYGNTVQVSNGQTAITPPTDYANVLRSRYAASGMNAGQFVNSPDALNGTPYTSQDAFNFLQNGTAPPNPFSPPAQGGTSLTASSSAITGQPTVAPPSQQSLDQTLAQVQGYFKPLDQSTIDAIGQGVQTQYAPVLADQQRVNKLRDTMFAASRAQAGDTGFGQSDLAREGTIATTQHGVDALNHIRDLMAAETTAKLQAAQSQNFQQQQTYLQMAQQIQQQQHSALQDYIQNQANQQQTARTNAQSTLESISQLSPAEMAKLGDLSSIETSLGLPSGYIKGLQATQQAATNAKTTDQYATIFNEATKYANQLPVGQSFTFKKPDGTDLTFTGTKPDEYQIVDNKNGIFRVNKTSGAIQKIGAGTGSGDGTSEDQKSIQAFQKDASDLILKLDKGDTSWAGAYDSLKVKYPQADAETINAALGGGIPYSNGVFDTSAAYGRAKTK